MIYRKPTVEIIHFDDSDVITASGWYCGIGNYHCWGISKCSGSIISVPCVFGLAPEKSYRRNSADEVIAGPENDPFANM